jgi:hypothetical protein
VRLERRSGHHRVLNWMFNYLPPACPVKCVTPPAAIIARITALLQKVGPISNPGALGRRTGSAQRALAACRVATRGDSDPPRTARRFAPRRPRRSWGPRDRSACHPQPVPENASHGAESLSIDARGCG